MADCHKWLSKFCWWTRSPYKSKIHLKNGSQVGTIKTIGLQFSTLIYVSCNGFKGNDVKLPTHNCNPIPFMQYHKNQQLTFPQTSYSLTAKKAPRGQCKQTIWNAYDNSNRRYFVNNFENGKLSDGLRGICRLSGRYTEMQSGGRICYSGCRSHWRDILCQRIHVSDCTISLYLSALLPESIGNITLRNLNTYHICSKLP